VTFSVCRRLCGVISVGLMLIASALSVPASAAESQQCKTVRFGVVDWTDVQVTTAIAQVLLDRLGYNTEVSDRSVPDVYAGLADSSLDVFLGNWMPTMTDIVQPYEEKGQVKTVTKNLESALYTLAVPDYVYEAGVRSFADIAEHKDKFGGRIYGIEKGNDGNMLIIQMIENNAFGLQDFEILETSERLMLAQVKGKIRRGEWIVFLAWKPHPMNETYSIRYLAGGDDYFGPDYGASTVYTNTRAGLAADCPNVSKLLNNLMFTLQMEGAIMDQVMNGFVPPDRAARDWMFNNPDQVSEWLQGVTDAEGNPVNPGALAQSMELKFE